MKILLIDSHVSFCEGVKAAMQAAGAPYELDYEADAHCVANAIVNKAEYDLLLLELVIPGMAGIDLLRQLAANQSPVPVLILSSVEDKAMIREAFELGAVGYLSKSSSIRQILDAVEHCSQGHRHIPEQLLSEQSPGPPGESSSQEPRSLGVTRRQLQIVGLMEMGLSNQEIADQLFISKATVKTHVNHLFRTLGVRNRISCVREARKRGLTEVAPESVTRQD